MQIVSIPISQLTPYKLNARRHTEYQIDKIRQSIENYGFNDPIGVWGDQNIVVEGHGRIMAAKKLGMTEVPCIRLDHMTEEQRREYAVNHNYLTDLSTFDWSKIVRDLEPEQLERLEIDVPVFDKMGASQGDRKEEKITPPVIFPVTIMENQADYEAFQSLKEELGFKKDVDLVRYLTQNHQASQNTRDPEPPEWEDDEE